MKVKELLQQIEAERKFYPDIDEMEIEIELVQTYWGSLDTDYTDGHLTSAYVRGGTKAYNYETKKYDLPVPFYLKLGGYVE